MILRYSFFLLIVCFSWNQLSSQATQQMINPNDHKHQTIVVEPLTLPKGFFRTGLSYLNGKSNVNFNDSWKREANTGSQAFTTQVLNFTQQYGVSDKLQVSLRVPFSFQKMQASIYGNDLTSDWDSTYYYEFEGNGIDDITIELGYQIVGLNHKHPSVTLFTGMTFPTGRKNPKNTTDPLSIKMPIGSGCFASHVDLKMKKVLYPFAFTLSSGIEYRFKSSRQIALSDFNWTEQEVGFQEGVNSYNSFDLTMLLNDWISISNTLWFFYHSPVMYDKNPYFSDSSDPSISFIYCPSVYFQIRKIRFVQSVMFRFAGRNIPADPSYMVLLQYIL